MSRLHHVYFNDKSTSGYPGNPPASRLPATKVTTSAFMLSSSYNTELYLSERVWHHILVLNLSIINLCDNWPLFWFLGETKFLLVYSTTNSHAAPWAEWARSLSNWWGERVDIFKSIIMYYPGWNLLIQVSVSFYKQLLDG